MSVREFRNEIRWTLVVVVLAGLAIYALWPRDPEPRSAAPDAAQSQQPASQQQRAAASLSPCPSAPGSGPARLAGVSVTCAADGSRVDLAATLAGRPTLVNVWATWCVPCREELPALQAYSERPDAVRVLGVQVRSSESDGLDLLRQLGVHFPIVHDVDNRIPAVLRAPVMPMSYVVTRTGEVRRVSPPVAFESPHEVDAAVRRTLGGTGG